MGIGELLIVLAVVLIFFGGAKLPALGAGLGKAIRNFKTAVKDDPAPRKEPPAPPTGPA